MNAAGAPTFDIKKYAFDTCAFCGKQRNQVAGMCGSSAAPIFAFICILCVDMFARALDIKVKEVARVEVSSS